LGGQFVVFPLFLLLIIVATEAHILVRNATPNESRSNWDLPSGVLPYLLDRPFGPVNIKFFFALVTTENASMSHASLHYIVGPPESVFPIHHYVVFYD
jgi:hypothetical protein